MIPASDEGECLGYWWRGDLLATRSVDENMRKARSAFFHHGSIGVFQGDICPLSSKSVLECCVMPVLLYGADNRIMVEHLWQKLESFQAGLVKRTLRWPKHPLNTAALLAVDASTIRCRVLIVKLRFLQRVMESDHRSLSGQMVQARSDNVNSLCMVKEFRELEEYFGTHFTSDILEGRDLSLKYAKKTILECDRKQLVAKCFTKAPTIAVSGYQGRLEQDLGCCFGPWGEKCQGSAALEQGDASSWQRRQTVSSV